MSFTARRKSHPTNAGFNRIGSFIRSTIKNPLLRIRRTQFELCGKCMTGALSECSIRIMFMSALLSIVAQHTSMYVYDARWYR